MSANEDDDDETKELNKVESVSIHYEWEEELDEYDEPDIYPSEKDYKWFDETVTDEEEEEEGEKVEEPNKETTDQDEQASDVSETVVTEEQPTEGEKPASPKETENSKVDKSQEGEEGAEDEEEFMPTIGVEQDEQEEDAAPKKRYKTIKVRRLVERPPKIYHTAEKIRIEEITNSPEDFTENPFKFLHSFGYDCQRLGNLIVLDSTTLLFMSGFVLTFYNHNTSQKTYLRSLGGGSFGSIALHPSRKLFAAAEKGLKPLIGIWSWPKLQLFRILEEGTESVYASVNFSPDGKLLASQGGSPDFLITVWNWLAQAPILRVKSHVQDVYRVTFAKELAGLLTTSGLCHIKFWKMAGTFTGLKLKGDVGRFGRTELSDIEGYVEMPDGKVLSGTEWGNLLLWENGLVIAELCMTNSAPCHSGIIRQILMVEGDFFTTGQDGLIKVWRYEEVDTAEIHTTTESLKVALKPVTNVTVNEEGDIWSIFQDPYNNDDFSVFWFAQDGKGFIWLVDLSFLNIAKEPKVVLTAHGGPIVDSAMSPTGNMIATLGGDGKLIIHDYITKQIVALRNFSAPGSCLLWPHHGDNENGCMMIAGFADGVIRILLLSGKPSDKFPMSLCLLKVYKPHRKRVTCIALDSDGEFLVSGGEDGTIFFFNAKEGFCPLCYIEMPFLLEVHKLLWSKFVVEQKVVIAICKFSLIQEIEMPSLEAIDNTTSYCFKNAKFLRSCSVRSIKSVLRRNEELNRKQKEEDEKQAAIERENQRLIDDGIETQEEQDARLLEEALEIEKNRISEPKKEKAWQPYIPPVPNSILVAFQDHLDPDVMHVTMDDYDAGYIYSIRLMSDDAQRVVGKEAEEPFNAVPIIDSGDVPVSKLVFINNGTKLLIGFKDGRIRTSPLMYEFELESMRTHWTMGAHDVVRGNITSITLNNAETLMFTTGMDGNCFMYSLVDDRALENFFKKVPETENPPVITAMDAHDITSPDAYTLEDSKNVEKERAILLAAKKNKAAKREKIAQLRFRFADVLSRNNELPHEIRLTPVELSVASDNILRCQERYDEALERLKHEMAWHCEYVRLGLEKVKSFFVDRLENQLFIVKAFNSNNQVSSFRLSKFPDFFEDAKIKASNIVDNKYNLYEHADDDVVDEDQEYLYEEPRPKREKGMNKFVHQRIVRIWERRQRKLKRKKEWDDFLKTDPSEQELEDDMAHINAAQMQIGDMKLKIDPNYKVPESRRLTVTSARKNLINLEERMFEYQKKFNNHLIDLRNRKVKVISRLNDYCEKIKACQVDIPELKRQEIPTIPTMSVEEDPKALLHFTKEDVLHFQQRLQVKAMSEGMHAGGAHRKGEMQKRRRRSWNVAKNEGEEEVKVAEPSEVIPSVPSALELELKHIKTVQAEFYQKYFIECIEKEKFMFDAKLKIMKHKKVKLDYDLKIAEARMINLTEEFILAQKSVSMEANLEYIVKQCTQEKRVCTNTMKTLQKSIDSYKAQLDSIQAKRNALLKEVLEIATNAPSYEKYLIRVFRKKITAAKRNKSDDDEDAGSEDSDDSDESEDMALDEEDDEEDDLDVDLPPQDLKTWIYEAVVEVRSRRLDLDDTEIKLRTSMDELVTQTNGFKQRMNVADNTLKRTKQELDKFNLEKQFKLNSNEGEVSMKLHQIHYMHTDLEKALVINKKDIKRLRNRIPELQREKRIEKKRVLSTKNQYKKLYREDKMFRLRLKEYDNECDKEMMRKFGRVKPIEELEHFKEDPEITKMKKELREMEAKYEETLREIEDEVYNVTEESAELSLLQRQMYSSLLSLHQCLSNINQAMDAGLSVMPQKVDDESGAQEIRRMKEVVDHQRTIIDYLKGQIAGLTKQAIKPLPPIASHK